MHNPTNDAPLSEPTNADLAKNIKSAFYIGNVFHKRLTPKVHQFNYPLYMMFLDLDETDILNKKYWWFSVNRWGPLQLKISDYFKSIPATTPLLLKNNSRSLKDKAISIAEVLGANIDTIDRVGMLAQLRCFGIYFSPVNFFFLYEGNSEKYLLAEVSNTPWNEKHCYLIDLENPELTPKTFHVSPFMDLNMSYKWDVKAPLDNTIIRIENWNEKLLFTALFSAKRHEISRKIVFKILLRWPLISVTIIKGIYWQAVKLLLKGIRYIPHKNQ